MRARLKVIGVFVAASFSWAAVASQADSAEADASAVQADFVARGNEPGWLLRLSAEAIVFTPMDGSPVTVAPVPQASDVDGARVYEASVGGSPFRLSIAAKVCADTMSGMPHPASVELVVGGKTLSGCGGEPASLLEGEWLVTEISGKPVVKDSVVTLEFGSDGHLSGNASCNRYFSGFSLTGEGLKIEAPGVSMMMCEPAELMAQEGLFLATLAEVERFEIRADGSLGLVTAGAGAILAQRKP